MNTVLITFIVVLFLLTLLSSFGGSIRPSEPFYDEMPPEVVPASSATETFYAEADATATPSPMTLSMQSSDVPPPPAPKEQTPEEKAKESLLATMREVQSITAQSVPTVDKFTNLEKFETGIPEPFEEDDLHVGAPF
jgi:cytoskeletal protein RodZ